MMRFRFFRILRLVGIAFVQVVGIGLVIGAQPAEKTNLDAVRDTLFDVQPAGERIAALRTVKTFYLSTAGDGQGTDRLVAEVHKAFGWTETTDLGEADVVLFFQSKAFVDNALNTVAGSPIPYVDGSGFGAAPGPMPERVDRKTVALITNQKSPRLLYLYQVDNRHGVWSSRDAVRNLKEFIDSAKD